MVGDDGVRKIVRPSLPEAGQYVLRSVLDDIPLRAEPDLDSDVWITSVEHWNDNLYIGTSASEILHLVGIPAEHENEPPTYILASRLQPSGHATNPPANCSSGVQQILVLPGPMRACVLCNGVLSFYTLPELTPASSKEQTGVQWLGGWDLNEGRDTPDGVVVMIAISRKMILVRVGDRLRHVKYVDYSGCLRSSRRDTIACVASDKDYALLEVEHQQQIPLFPISTSTNETEPLSRKDAASPSGHSRSTSLGNPLSASLSGSNQSLSGQHLFIPKAEEHTGSESPGTPRPGSRPRSSTETLPLRLPPRKTGKMKPHILSPTPTEFLLTTGTTMAEPGVGLFVNLDGEVVRGTIEFDRYPEALLAHSFDDDANITDENSSLIFALLDKSDTAEAGKGIEVQALSGMGHSKVSKSWLPLPADTQDIGGLYQCVSPHRYAFTDVTTLLLAVRYKPSTLRAAFEPDSRTKASIRRLEEETALFDDQSPQAASPTLEYEQKRNQEEAVFVGRTGLTSTRLVVWSGTRLWQVLQNPLLLQLEHTLLSSDILQDGTYSFASMDKSKVLTLIGSLRDREPRNENEFFTLRYIRQKASMLLFLHLQATMSRDAAIEPACQLVRNALGEGSIDPRIVLLSIPALASEVLQGPTGLWIQQGISEALSAYDSQIHTFKDAPIPFWLMVRHFLSDWQEKRGYGSIPDEKYVFDSVDAALLHTLLYLDQALPEGSGLQTATRAKLNNVVDNFKGDFQRAIILLEHYRRLFVLSRLYQSKKLAKDVLATWKRIVEGEEDQDRSLTIDIVQVQIRRYLTKIKNAKLVQEYGLWLARRDPDFAVQVFAADESVVKFPPSEIVEMLKAQAPGAVQQYLEHLVFAKHQDQYADDLIGYFLDSVLSVLESSPAAKQSLEESYSAYRALESPKPTYLNFITDNAPPEQWWQSRLRLLQLLGSGGYGKSSSEKELTYSVEKVLERLTPFSSYLVSESVILDARQGRHREALRLLTHGLGDYDTAVRYCYFGGPAPTTTQPLDASLLPTRETQKDLFAWLLYEFLRIEDAEEQLDRTSHLLGTFATWFDPLTVFSDIPESWTVDRLSEFLLRSIRAATSEKNEALIMRALSAAQNLQKQATFIEACEKVGPQVQTEEIQPRSDSAIVS